MLSKVINKLRSLPSYHDMNRLHFLQRSITLENHILHDEQQGVSNEKYCDSEIIVSLTTYGKRLRDVCLTIESIMQQTLLPNRIVLNLDYSYNGEHIPNALKKQMDRGLEINFCKDIRSYTKLIPTIKKYPADAVITIDDDVIYSFDLIENLVISYLSKPNNIHSARTHVMTFNQDKSLKSYNDWKMCSSDCDNPRHLFFTGVGGVLYPPGCLGEEVMNEEVFSTICPMADDVWFNAMALKNGTEITKVPTRSSSGEDYVLNDSVQDVGLFNINTGVRCENDRQIEAVFAKYDLLKLLH